MSLYHFQIALTIQIKLIAKYKGTSTGILRKIFKDIHPEGGWFTTPFCLPVCQTSTKEKKTESLTIYPNFFSVRVCQGY